jgi:integrase/recombinase XerD
LAGQRPFGAAGPVASQLGSFFTSLIDQQYAASVTYIKVLRALAFDRWLAKRRIALAELSELRIERYQNRTRGQQRRIRTETRQLERRDVTHLLDFLRTQGVCTAAHVETTAAQALVDRFAQHLRDQQGLATATIERYRRVARQFFEDRFGHGSVDLHTLRHADAIAFVKHQSERLQPPALKCVANALRSFLRYAQ